MAQPVETPILIDLSVHVNLVQRAQFARLQLIRVKVFHVIMEVFARVQVLATLTAPVTVLASVARSVKLWRIAVIIEIVDMVRV